VSYNEELEARCEHLEKEMHKMQKDLDKKYNRWRRYKDRLAVYEKRRDYEVANTASDVKLGREEVMIQVIGRAGTGKTVIAQVIEQAIQKGGLECVRTNLDGDTIVNVDDCLRALKQKEIRVRVIERQSRRVIMP
jgi:ABC-type glutathione transport system ATPase component